jgi:hypothetical protein
LISFAVVLAAAVIALLIPSILAGWAPLVHWTCSEQEMSREVTWIPVVLINSPFGGYASGNGSLPAGYLGPKTILPSASGTDAYNGNVSGVLYEVWGNVSRDTNEMAWGPGANVRCSQAYTVRLGGLNSQPPSSYSGGLFGPGLQSDLGEPHEYNFSTQPSGSTVYFSNGFVERNSANISTCGKTAQSLSIPLHKIDVTIAIPPSSGSNYPPQPLVLPLDQSYHYVFPANFGTWQVDNLSAAGGPGGGWAFSYSQCP